MSHITADTILRLSEWRAADFVDVDTGADVVDDDGSAAVC
jgi:hypothetical protein